MTLSKIRVIGRVGLTALAASSLGSTAWADQWFSELPMITAREKLASCVVGQQLFTFGGAADENSAGLQASEVLDVGSGAWSARAPMPTGNSYVTASAVSGRCYVFGGRSGFGNPGTDLNQRYDPGSDNWVMRAAMPTPRFAAASVSLGDRIYVMGGTATDSGPILDVVESYHPQSNTWSSHAPMPTAKVLFALEEVDGILYAIGGSRGPGTQFDVVEVYDPQGDSWSTLTAMPTARQGMASGVIDGRIYVAGGGTGTMTLGVVEAFDPASNSWETLSPMPTARVRLAGDVVDGMLYTVGGARNLLPPHPGQSTVERYQPPELVASQHINFGHIGSWYNPLTNGQGFNFDVLVNDQGEAETLVVYAFTYDNALVAQKFDGQEQRWFVAAGPISGDTATMTLTLTTGGVFDDPTPTQTTVVGSMRFTAQSCTQGEINMRVDQNVAAEDELNVSIPVVRLSPDVMCEQLAGR